MNFGRAGQAVVQACWWHLPWVAFDLETTGLDPARGARVIEVAAYCKIAMLNVTKTLRTVKPSAKTGSITRKQAADAVKKVQSLPPRPIIDKESIKDRVPRLRRLARNG